LPYDLRTFASLLILRDLRMFAGYRNLGLLLCFCILFLSVINLRLMLTYARIFSIRVVLLIVFIWILKSLLIRLICLLLMGLTIITFLRTDFYSKNLLYLAPKFWKVKSCNSAFALKMLILILKICCQGLSRLLFLAQ